MAFKKGRTPINDAINDEETEATASPLHSDGSETPGEFKIIAWLAFLIIKVMVLLIILSML